LIRINLLTVDRERAKRKATAQVVQKVTVGCSLILVMAALVVGWWFWSLQHASADLDRQIADAERETQRLESVIQQVTQFERRRAQLQQRVRQIEELRKGQRGPVHLLDQISKALPEAMWLTDLRQAANDITLEGRCTSLDSVSDFVSALETSELFERPVEIIDSRVEAATTSTPELIRFSVRARQRSNAADSWHPPGIPIAQP
jgi:type IV pilus assembly protein PilN